MRMFKSLHRCIVVFIKQGSMTDILPDKQTSHDGRGTMTDNDRRWSNAVLQTMVGSMVDGRDMTDNDRRMTDNDRRMSNRWSVR